MSIDWPKIWSSTKKAAMTDTELAAELGTTRQNVSAARKRHRVPASPAGHGGARKEHGATITLRPSPDQRRRWLRAAKKAGLSLREWAEGKLDEVAPHAPGERNSQ